MIRKCILAALATASALGGMSQVVRADQLTASYWLPANHNYVGGFLTPMFEEIKERSGGDLTVRVLPQAVASPPGHLDAVRDGVVDIAFISVGYFPGQFGLTQLGMLPLQAESAEVRSVAFQRMYDKFVAPKVDEFTGVKNIAIWATGPGFIWTGDRKITTVDQAKGAKLRMSGGVALKIAEELGVTPVVKPATEAYELLSGGIIDGVMFPTEAICSFRLDELVHNVLVVPGATYADQTAVIMNPAAYEKLSDKNKALLNEYIGEKAARWGGHAFDIADEECSKKLKDRTISYNEGSEELVGTIRSKADALIAEWKDAATAAGIDADAAVDFYYAQLEELKAEMGKE